MLSISGDEIDRQLQRLLEAAAFRGSPQLSRFLRYTVEEAVAGRFDSLKESVLGVEACGRTNFDARYDTVVRSTASRLRNKLAEYYSGPGAGDPLIVEYPRGGYVPVWRRREEAPEGESLEKADTLRDGGVPTSQPPPSLRSSPALWIAVIAGGVIATGLVLWLLKRDDWSQAQTPVRFEVRLPERHNATNLGSTGTITISPDSRMLAASLRDNDGSLSLWIHRFESGIWTKIENTRGALAPFWSPDSEHVGFFQNNQMKRVPVSGNPIQVLATSDTRASIATWLPSGKIVYSDKLESPLRIIPDIGGTSQPVTSLQAGESAHTGPHALPDGRRFLYTALHKDRAKSAIFSASIDAPQEAKLLREAFSTAGYLERKDGKGLLLFASNGILVGQDFDPQTAELGTTQTTVSPQIAFYPFRALADFGVARNGTLVFRTGPGFEQRHLVWLDPQGKRLAAPSKQGIYRYPDLSPDGKRIATEIIDPATSTGTLWLMDSPSFADAVKLTAGNMVELGPVWSPDGKRLAFVRDNDIYIREVQANSDPVRITSTPESKRVTSWSPDGKELLFYLYSPETRYDVAAAAAEPGAKIRRLLESRFDEREATLSPDGKYLAYMSNQTGQAEIYVEPYPLAPARTNAVQVSQANGSAPAWSRDGRELFFTSSAPFRMMVVQMNRGLPTGPPREAFTIAPYLQRGFGHARDRATGNFLFSMPVPDTFLSLPTVILNPHAARAK